MQRWKNYAILSPYITPTYKPTKSKKKTVIMKMRMIKMQIIIAGNFKILNITTYHFRKKLPTEAMTKK